jgi:hypothetical protein
MNPIRLFLVRRWTRGAITAGVHLGHPHRRGVYDVGPCYVGSDQALKMWALLSVWFMERACSPSINIAHKRVTSHSIST